MTSNAVRGAPPSFSGWVQATVTASSSAEAETSRGSPGAVTFCSVTVKVLTGVRVTWPAASSRSAYHSYSTPGTAPVSGIRIFSAPTLFWGSPSWTGSPTASESEPVSRVRSVLPPRSSSIAKFSESVPWNPGTLSGLMGWRQFPSEVALSSSGEYVFAYRMPFSASTLR
ncbi:hypothetical protein ACFFX0_19190 [Citricoccus parietis]|uniref:Uncharacterized protein n=1 Tax=Citricoccus parietis TaxID=592307 RepID=A0ABV5G2Q2_9MICC